jgi:hypothetical protein
MATFIAVLYFEYAERHSACSRGDCVEDEERLKNDCAGVIIDDDYYCHHCRRLLCCKETYINYEIY